MTAFDVYEDFMKGTSRSHLILEISVVIIATIGSILYMSVMIKERKHLNYELNKTRDDLNYWKDKSEVFIKGLSVEIDNQLELWRFSKSEKEIAILLVKGLSTKEISAIRKTKEKTVRTQTTSIYRKASVSGRHELSAFFLEDLFVPST
ncbi:MAG: helix-turn-helix transcriptional regulator [Halobacteriovoraceae bacterium]|nr:helix-turn-helix transcriptional regulator [Halobacteriovoraceae bacterium]